MSENIIRDLDDGLIIRHSNPEDAEHLAKFNKDIHGEEEWDSKGLQEWTLDLISGKGPTFSSSDFTIVEDPASGEIVSSCCLISQTWSYEGIPFKVGRPELVGTKKEYRRRGLIREQFEILHAWSAERGELAQAITGIPYYYRQFGYEMTLNLGGGRAGYSIHVPELKEDEKEPFSFRLAQEADIPFLQAAYKRGCERNLISGLWDDSLWRYEVVGKRKYNINRREFYIIEDPEGAPAGCIAIPPVKWGNMLALQMYEVMPGYAWVDVTPSVIRFLWEKGEALGEEQDQPHNMFGFWLGEKHPAYQVAVTKLPRVRKPYAFYMRVPDLPAFLRQIKPVLENRLEGSAFTGYTGSLKLSFYKDGVNLEFSKGHIKAISALGRDELDKCDAFFPSLTFLHLLFGYRSIEDIKHLYADCSTKDDETGHLMDALFPRKPSHIWSIS